MILKGSQRGGGGQLARHLTRLDENDHVEVHELRGFNAATLRGALREAEAVSKGTRCRQYLFSLSLNPPERENVSAEDFTAAADRIESKLDLTDQARAIVIHEKEGRRHAHVVWSRIDVETMKAVNLPHFKRKLQDVSRELYLEHGWRLPDGLRDRRSRNPFNFTREEWQQAKRTRQDPKVIKHTLTECWTVSDDRDSFEAALSEKGFFLARGDRRGFVAVDVHGEVYSLSRTTGVKTQALTERLGKHDTLPTVEQTKAQIAERMTARLQGFIDEAEARARQREQDIERRKAALRERQRGEREKLKREQSTGQSHEAQGRAARFRKGVRGVWDWISGRTAKTRKQNEREAAEAARRDERERSEVISQQLEQRRALQRGVRELKAETARDAETLRMDISRLSDLMVPSHASTSSNLSQRAQTPRMER